MDPACKAYSGCDPRFPVQYCEHSEGHDWPDFASEAIWNFFTSLPPAVPSDKPGNVDIENLGKGTISFTVLYPTDFVGTPYKLALALYPYDSFTVQDIYERVVRRGMLAQTLPLHPCADSST